MFTFGDLLFDAASICPCLYIYMYMHVYGIVRTCLRMDVCGCISMQRYWSCLARYCPRDSVFCWSASWEYSSPLYCLIWCIIIFMIKLLSGDEAFRRQPAYFGEYVHVWRFALDHDRRAGLLSPRERAAWPVPRGAANQTGLYVGVLFLQHGERRGELY